MSQILLVCQYCGNRWKDDGYRFVREDPKCFTCGDTNIKVKELSGAESDVFGYNKDTQAEDAWIKRRKK